MSDRYGDDVVDLDAPGGYDDELDRDVVAPSPTADVEALLHRVVDTLQHARPMPLSASVMINRDEVLDLIEEALARLPDELREARWLLREREEYLAKVSREGEDILEAARQQAERMVERTEVVRKARQVARQVVDEADDHARRIRHEAEDYCDQKLAQFEIVLDRTMRAVHAGRSRLQVVRLEEAPPEDDADAPGAAFFDQDQG